MIITRHEFLELTTLDQDTLDIWLEEEWILPETRSDNVVFTEMDVARARLIRSMTSEMGVNAEGIGIILHLLDQIYALRAALKLTAGALEPDTGLPN